MMSDYPQMPSSLSSELDTESGLKRISNDNVYPFRYFFFISLILLLVFVVIVIVSRFYVALPLFLFWIIRLIFFSPYRIKKVADLVYLDYNTGCLKFFFKLDNLRIEKPMKELKNVKLYGQAIQLEFLDGNKIAFLPAYPHFRSIRKELQSIAINNVHKGSDSVFES